nr:MBL fold metallo-hydrolase [Bacillus niameyensis]
MKKTDLSLTLFQTGYCVHPEKVTVKDGSWKKVKFPALVGLIEHPEKGYILFDTGYAEHFFAASRKFPYSIYPKVTPVYFEDEQSIKNQLSAKGIYPEDISYIIISHFHGDHIGGLLDFPKSTYICFKRAYQFIKDKKGFSAIKNGYLPDLLPKDFLERVIFLEEGDGSQLSDDFSPFTEGWDIFQDGSLFAVDLTGHAIGQMGIFLHDSKMDCVFLCADACWQSRAYREKVFPNPLAYLIMPDVRSYQENLIRLHQLHEHHPKWKILPTHCQEIWRNDQ